MGLSLSRCSFFNCGCLGRCLSGCFCRCFSFSSGSSFAALFCDLLYAACKIGDGALDASKELGKELFS